MVGIIDYGMGNLLSVYHAVEMAGADVQICREPEELDDAERLILPGVGAFRDCIMNLTQKGFVEALQESVIRKGTPILGICLGMQVMARRSLEGGEFHGLGWYEADVVRLTPDDASLRVPHTGWNDVTYRSGSVLFANLPPMPDFYFVHSYYMACDRPEDIEATCDYGGIFTAAVRKANIFATQFHPEKSQDYGMCVLKNFLKWRP
jgi:imidazole glycerol-phosphate synthase subunit HisH